MKLCLMSDLHLEFGPFGHEMPRGDVLVLAGDITLAKCLDPKQTDAQARKLRERTHEFFDAAKANFDRVFYLMGNHEAYGFSISETPRAIRKHLPTVTLLNDTVVGLDGQTILVGGTLWTDMNRGKAHEFIGGRGYEPAKMNDFNVVRVTKGNSGRVFTTHDAVKRHGKTLRLIRDTAADNPDKTIIVATHHQPSFSGINPDHGGGMLDAGYASDLEGFIAAHQNIRFWLCGHTHVQKEYRVAQCRVLANCRGYVGMERCAQTFDPSCWVETEGVAEVAA